MLNGSMIMDQRLLSVFLAVYIRIGRVKGLEGHRNAHVVDLFCGVLPRHRYVEIPATTPVRPQRGLAGACGQLTSSLAIISIARYNPESRLNQDSFKHLLPRSHRLVGKLLSTVASWHRDCYLQHRAARLLRRCDHHRTARALDTFECRGLCGAGRLYDC